MTICKLKHLKGTDHWFVDGVCGFQISDGDTPREAIINAIYYIIHLAKDSNVQNPLWYDSANEVFYLSILYEYPEIVEVKKILKNVRDCFGDMKGIEFVDMIDNYFNKYGE
jgi:hypothetical protein